MDYVFCEFCSTEVEKNDSLVLDSQAICIKCWDKRFLMPIPTRYKPHKKTKINVEIKN